MHVASCTYGLYGLSSLSCLRHQNPTKFSVLASTCLLYILGHTTLPLVTSKLWRYAVHKHIQQLHVKLAALQDLFKYCSFALVLQLALFILYASRAHRHEQNVTMVVRRLIYTVIAAVPPTLPAVLIVCLFRCGIVLRQQHIHLQHSTKIKTAAATEVLVLDKTGTLTASQVYSSSAPPLSPS